MRPERLGIIVSEDHNKIKIKKEEPMKLMQRTQNRYNHSGLNTIANLFVVSGIGFIAYSVVQLIVAFSH